MIGIFWNVCGAGKPLFCRNLRYMIRKNEADFVVIIEPKISGARAASVCDRINMDSNFRVEARGFSGGIWIVWDSARVMISVLASNDHCIHAVVTKNNIDV